MSLCHHCNILCEPGCDMAIINLIYHMFLVKDVNSITIITVYQNQIYYHPFFENTTHNYIQQILTPFSFPDICTHFILFL